MLRRVIYGLSAVALTAALVWPVWAAAPVKLSEVAPIADLVAEADAKVKALESALASNEEYTKAKKATIPTEAGVLAVLAQAIAEHGEKAAWSASAPAVRDAAIALANAGSYEDAKTAYENVKKAHGGDAGSAKPEHEWKSLSKLGAVMPEVNKRNGKLRRAVKKVPEDPTAASRDASVLAVLAVFTHEDTHEVKNQPDVPKWQGYSKDMQTSFSELAAALKAKDTAKINDAWKKGGKSCADCHEAFRDK